MVDVVNYFVRTQREHSSVCVRTVGNLMHMVIVPHIKVS